MSSGCLSLSEPHLLIDNIGENNNNKFPYWAFVRPRWDDVCKMLCTFIKHCANNGLVYQRAV